MGFTFDIGVGLPVDLLGWLMQLLPAGLAIALERSTTRSMRTNYIFTLCWYPFACVILVFIASVVAMAFGHKDQQSFGFYLIARDPIFLTPISAAALAIEALFRVLVARLIVRRLRDGEINKKWAYLILIPFIDLIVLVGLLFYPPSAANAEALTQELPQT